MKLSVPIFRLKRQARLRAREAKIPLSKALDLVARENGFQSWSQLAAHEAAQNPALKIFHRLNPGDLLLLGARPGQGKTTMALQLIAEAIKASRRGVFFTLEYSDDDVLNVLRSIGPVPETFNDAFAFDTSDAISADYIIEKLGGAGQGTVVVIDYLQLLDQKREMPELAVQIAALESFARKAGLIIIFIAQINRAFDPAVKPLPDRTDVRLPNPLDLKLFDKNCFLHDGEARFDAAA